MTKVDLEKASGGGDREDWFEEGECFESSKVERQSASNCKRNGVIRPFLLREQNWMKTE